MRGEERSSTKARAGVSRSRRSAQTAAAAASARPRQARWSCGLKASGSAAIDAGICYFITDFPEVAAILVAASSADKRHFRPEQGASR